jgi:peptidoglycan/LPS O-acetylase OafA/YrhL
VSESPATPRSSQDRIAGLDGLRAVSIVLVLAAHAWPTAASGDNWDWLRDFAGNSTLGVTTFFVVSGYLITWLLRQEHDATGTISLGSFYMRRVLRIFPAFYTYLLVVTAIRALGWIHTEYGDIATAGAFLTNYAHYFRGPSNADYWFVGHFWTLSLEEQFYLLWPATLIMVGIRRAPRVAGTIIVVAPLLRVATYFLWPESREQITMMLHTAADPIMFGCLAALAQGTRPLERVLDRFRSARWPLIAAFFVLVVSPWLTHRFHGAYHITAGMTLDSATIAFIVLWVVEAQDSALTHALSVPLVRRIGVLSYSLYLWQQLFLARLNTTWTGAFPVNLLLAFAAAELSFRLVESPFLRLRKRFQPVGVNPVPSVALVP